MMQFLEHNLEFIAKGQMMIYPLLFCSLVSLAIIIERFFALLHTRVDREKLLSRLEELLKNDRVIEAISACDEVKRPLAKVIKAGLLKHDRSDQEVKETMRDVAQLEISYLEKYLPILTTIIYVAPLLGFLGTVLGMIEAFQAWVGFAGQRMLTSGVWEALITTAAGLLVAIVSFVAHNYFVNQVDNFLVDVEHSAIRLTGSLQIGRVEESGV